MRKLKILYGLEAVGGGALKHLVYLATNLDHTIFDITIILSEPRNESIDSQIDSLKKSGANLIMLNMCRNINLFKDLWVLLKLIALIFKGKYDIVHAHSSKAGGLFRFAAYLCNIPAIYYTPHCFYFQGKSGLKKIKFVWLEKILAKLTTMLIVSESERKAAIENKITNNSKILNINNAIDFDEYQQYNETKTTRESLGIPEKAFIAAAIGRLVPQKDWETYIFAASEVIKTHPETIFLIVGDGILKEEIKKLIFKLNLEAKVILTGYVHNISKIYGIIDVLVNTSLWEGLPYVFLEAMRYKKPIIATNTGNNNTIIDGKSGFISAVKDYHSIAQKIIHLIEDKQMKIRMGNHGMDLLTKKYSFELFISKHEQLYKDFFLG